MQEYLDQIKCGDCLDLLHDIPDGSIDLIVTSPPYANQRKNTYGGISESEYVGWFMERAAGFYRVLSDTGNFVLNIKEHVVNGIRSTYVMDLIASLSSVFRWTDTYIWVKTNPFPTGSNRRTKDAFEYCYWFTKTKNYKFFPENALVKSTSRFLESEKRRKNKGEHPVRNGSGMNVSRRIATDMVRPSNVLTFPVDTSNHEHPAVFPIALPEFFIKTMTKPGENVLDPFCGSGTTLKAAKDLGRHYVGFEISAKYCEIANNRVDKLPKEIKNAV